MKENGFSKIDPYQILFPLGLAHAVFGASLWILFSLKLTAYPGPLHAHHMVDGFLLSFAAGFLLTAIPRFTGADRSSPAELLIATALSVLCFFESKSVVAFGMLLFLSVFFGRRIKKRTFSPPPHFIFLPIGLLLGLSGSALLSLIQFGLIDARYSTAARVFLYYGMMLSFLLGIGAKLISALLGWTAPPTHRIEPLNSLNRPKKPDFNKWVVPCSQGVLFLVSFPIELIAHPGAGRSLRALCATWIGIQNWKIYKKPKAPGKLPVWLCVSTWFLILGLWIHALFPSLGVHAAHLIFISGFGLITLLVASRVTLAHGGYSLELESRSRIFAMTSLLIILTALTRVTAAWTASYFQHLAYAGAVWILSILGWSVFFLPKIIFHSTNVFSFRKAWSKYRRCVCGKKHHHGAQDAQI
jgi:uncharacterized protein involved in response to NO